MRRISRRRGAVAALAVLTAVTATLTVQPPAVAVPVDLERPRHHEQARPDDFVIATFNVLGHSHTTRSGGPHTHHGFLDSSVRMAMAALVLHDTDVDVVGFQELQHLQYQQLISETRALGERWGVFSGSRRDTDNTIAWRTSRFRLVRGWRVSIPYFHGHPRPMPVVALRSRTTGRVLYVMNVHNPADTRGPAAHWRRIAIAKERRVTTHLSEHERAPVFLTGDMNDRAAFFCPITANGVLRSVLGGSHQDGRCRPPKSGVDWILANRQVAFRSHRIDRSLLVSEATDHPVVSAHVRVTGP